MPHRRGGRRRVQGGDHDLHVRPPWRHERPSETACAPPGLSRPSYATPRHNSERVTRKWRTFNMVEGKGVIWRGPRRPAHMHASAWTSPGRPCPTVPTIRNRRNPAQPRRRPLAPPGR